MYFQMKHFNELNHFYCYAYPMRSSELYNRDRSSFLGIMQLPIISKSHQSFKSRFFFCNLDVDNHVRHSNNPFLVYTDIAMLSYKERLHILNIQAYR